jgi:hypothetical protein
VEIGVTPPQRVQTTQHVVGYLDIHGAQFVEVQRERLTVVRGGDKTGDANDLAGAAALAQVEQAGERDRRGVRGRAGSRIEIVLKVKQ